MSTPIKNDTSGQTFGSEFLPPLSTSPAPSAPRLGSISGSVPRILSTARLASSPVPGGRIGSPPVRSGTPPVADSDNGSIAPSVGPAPGPAGPGVSALAAALSNSIGTSPPRMGTPPVRTMSPGLVSNQLLRGATPTNYGSLDQRSGRLTPVSAGTGAFENPEIIRRHLVQPSDVESEDGEPSSVSKGKQPEADPRDLDDEFSSLKLQGGDITRPIYKWTEDAEQRAKVQRSKSFTQPRPEPEDETLDIDAIKVPGGFRRNFLRRGADDNVEAAEAPQPRHLTSNFLEFLTIYGHFAGEELEEDDEMLLPGEYFSSGAEEDYFGEGSESDGEPMEDSALLTPSRRRRRHKKRGGSGNNTAMGATLLLLKSFVGTGVLFLPRAYLNGGMLFSNLVLLGVAGLSYYCFILLINTRLKVEGSFGDIGGILYGNYMRQIILASIVLSQLGFVAAYIVFTSENLRAVIMAVSDCKTYIDVKWLILMQMLIFMPFALLRDISKLGFTALIADAFILIGLAYLFYFDIWTLDNYGLSDIIQFNKDHWTLFIGTAIFTFEGIGLIIPIQESMKDQTKFPRVMGLVMLIITTLFIGMGAVSYAAYGSKTETVVLLNLPQDNRKVNAVQFLYSLAILLSTPLQIFPAIRITENALFTRSGKYNPYIKWQKNVFRFFVVALCAAIAWGGADNLDKFVALVGNFACIPLVYIYPPLLHYRGVARNRFWKIADVVLCAFGFIAMTYTTSLTVMQWSSPGEKLPGYCDSKKG
ncbi:putative vacuolar amino acid transporter [Zalerion maritima]|uniref:Vacuolar amino acid transporter n=1 Tax=Zalerion maritima TaxID=339359 RepID=A0AAD5WVC5_9PEZI|nr:putative vacuolar amino acid transporter [Zalerion maritima]